MQSLRVRAETASCEPPGSERTLGGAKFMPRRGGAGLITTLLLNGGLRDALFVGEGELFGRHAERAPVGGLRHDALERGELHLRDVRLGRADRGAAALEALGR